MELEDVWDRADEMDSKSCEMRCEAEDLETTAEKMKTLYQNLRTNRENSNYTTQLITNNGKFNFSDYSTYDVLDPRTKRIKIVSGGAAYKIIQRFADSGDLLCSELIKFVKSQEFARGLGRRDLDSRELRDVFYLSPIPYRLLSRTMTEEEYSGYLAGRLPFSRLTGEYPLSDLGEASVHLRNPPIDKKEQDTAAVA